MTGLRRFWFVTFILLPLVFWSDLYEGALLPRLLILQLGLALVVVWLALGRHRQPIPKKLIILTAFWVLAQVLSLFQSVNRTESFLQLSQYLVLTILPLLLAASMSARDLLPLARVIATASIPVSVIGICQYLGLAFLDLPSQAQPSATFFHRNAAASYLTAVIGMSGLCMVKSRRRSEKWLFALVTGLALIYLVFTRTRGVWVGVVAAAIAVGLMYLRYGTPREPNKLRRVSWSIVTACLLIVGTSLLPDRISVHDRPTFDDKKDSPIAAVTSIVSSDGHRGRLGLWRNTLKMIGSAPLLGVGLGNWEFQYPEYARGDHVNINAAPRRPHNDFLWIASETGLIGLAAHLCLIVGSLLAGVRAFRFGPTAQREVALAMLFVCVAHLVDGMFNFPRERIGGASLFWLAIGFLWILVPRDNTRISFPHRYLWVAVLIAGWGIWTTGRRIGYDYHHLRVHSAERTQDWPTVLTEGRKALTYGSLRANTWIAMGRAHYRKGEVDQAILSHRNALGLHPNSLNAQNNLGISLRKAGRTDEAILALRRAIELYPGFVEAHNNLGNALRDIGQIDASIRTFEHILEKPNAQIPQIYINLARSYVISGETRKAHASYTQALTLDPENLTAQRERNQIEKSHQHEPIDRS